MAGEIVVGYDGSDCSKAALREAVTLAGLFDTGVVVAFAAEPPAPSGEMADHRRALEELGQRLMAEALAQIDPGDITIQPIVMHARPAEGLLELAEQHAARMIVVGTHGERPLLGAILGSVPSKLLHRSPTPVLVVPAPA